ncbi:MAG: type II toxin-antitoxin system VapC family toxin [Pyrobaculum sp.]
MIVVDSSVFASVVVKDEFYDRCRLYVARGDKATVDIAYAEVANVVWKHVKMGRIPASEAAYRVRLANKIISSAKVYRSIDLLEEAVETAVTHGVAVYDALYLTLAVKLGAKLATTDRSLAERLGGQAISYIELL